MKVDKSNTDHITKRLGEANALLDQGMPGKANAVFDEIIAHQPKNVALLIDIAKRYQRANRPGFAAKTWRQVSEIQPDAEVFDTLGDIYEQMEKPYRAMCAFRSAAGKAPSNVNYVNKFYESLRKTPAKFIVQDAKELRDTIASCLIDGNMGHKRVMQTWVLLLLKDVEVERLMGFVENPHPESAEDDQQRLSDFLDQDYLTLGLRRIPVIADNRFESLMTAIRRFFLLNPDYLRGQYVPFLCALAEHCFVNEYVYWVTTEEHQSVEAMREELASTTVIDSESLARFALLACYIPLQNLPNASEISEFADQVEDVAFSDLVDTQINEPGQWRELASSIPALASIEDSVSSAVREMYEVNPYPRWRGISVYTPREARLTSEGRNILVAGCGTGQEALSRALRFPGASVLGIDLSLASLSYAKLMSVRYGIENLELMHADILKADRIEKEFDLIYSSGVLHHMDDPVAGWRQILTRLKTGGVMQISLYSELARQDVVRCRKWIEDKGIESTAMGIREFRKLVLDLDDDDPIKDIILRKDFYSLSHCRDLVFHVQEHRFTFPRLQQALDTLGLQLISMATLPWVKRRYREMFPADQRQQNLDNWDLFEHEHPEAFWGMYTFWCCRLGETPRLPDWVRN